MINYLEIIKQHRLSDLLLQGNFGLEKENLRTDLKGNLALTSHPAIFGDKALHPYITTDFAESQVEMVTPTFATPKDALNFMEALHDLVSLELKDEVLWPYSLPPVLPLDDNLIHEAQFNDPEITEYRQYLAHKYGKRKQLLSGVHYNFSFSDEFMHLLYNAEHSNLSFREFNDQVYLKIARYYLKYCWLIIYLFGANSVAHDSYIDCCRCDKEKFTDDSYLFTGASSFRNGISGYRNLEHFYVSYNSLYDYIDDIKAAISAGQIMAAKEYYSQLRLKGRTKGSVLDDLHDAGIRYIEIRTLDLNPLTKVGITLESLEFIHMLIIYALLAPDFSMSDDEYRLANQNQILAADGNRDNGINLHFSPTETRDLRHWGQEFIDNMYQLLKEIDMPQEKLQLLEKFKNELAINQQSIAEEVADSVGNEGYVNYFMTKANNYLELSKRTYYKFTGFEDLELSTQIILKEAIRRGIAFKFLDRRDNFIELKKGNVSQIIKQATKTAVDNYATISAMENKQVSKELMMRSGIIVPRGEHYCSIDAAMVDYPLYAERPVVVKPNSTNFGLGITIFKEPFSKVDFQRALEIAFSYDHQILIEDFINGKEYRFFVIDGQAVAILHREPANVIGDGSKTIRELVEIKNSDPLRGSGYKTPLEAISLGEVEAMFLAQQGFTFATIPSNGQKIYLRENSNISTGGETLDYTDIVPQSYKRIAVKAAKSVGAQICGVDMIIKNIRNPYPENNYALLELNFNPAIHIHTYPYQGKDRKLAERILSLLGLIE